METDESSIQRRRRHSVRLQRLTGARGLTLVELMLALAITTVIGISLAGILYSASYGVSSQTGVRSACVVGDGLARRLSAAVSSSQMVLAQGNGYLVLWLADPAGRSSPHLSCLCRVAWNSDTRELHCYKAPAGLSGASDTQYSLTGTDFNAVTQALEGTRDFPGQLWSNAVGGFSTSLDSVNPLQANLLSYSITVVQDDVSGTVVGSVALRCD